jgi:hypothetical protein
MPGMPVAIRSLQPEHKMTTYLVSRFSAALLMLGPALVAAGLPPEEAKIVQYASATLPTF